MKEVVVVYFAALRLYSPEGTERNDKVQTVLSVSQPRFDTVSSRIQDRIVIASASVLGLNIQICSI